MNLEARRQSIANRAEQAIDIPFRLHGRSVAKGLDCVGLVAHAISPLILGTTIPQHYSLRFGDLSAVNQFFGPFDFLSICPSSSMMSGDIIVTAPSVNQLHFLIITGKNYVHAHAGLRRIVKSNLPVLTPIKMIWRYQGD